MQRRTRFAGWVGAALVLALATPAGGQSVDLSERHRDVVLIPVAGGAEGLAVFPFELPQAGAVYAKLLAAPGNPVHDGRQANGTLGPEGRGTSGWWVEFTLATPGAAPHALGAFVNGTRTAAVALPGGQQAELRVLVHAPADAGNGTWTIPVVLGVARSAGASASGGVRDEAVAMRLLVTRSEQAPPPAPDAAPQTPPPSSTPPPLDRQPYIPTPSALATLAAVAVAFALAAWRRDKQQR